MSEALLNLIRREVERSLDRIARPRAGEVTNYDPVRMAVQVKFPEEIANDGDTQQTPWMPLKLPAVGAGWGVVCAPVLGAHALVEFLDGNPGSPYVSGFLPSLSEVPPAAQGGEIWLVHQTGSLVKLTSDGSITAQDHAGAKMVLPNTGKLSMQDAAGCSLIFENNGTATLDGSLTVTGDINDQNGAHGTLAAFRSDYNAHAHGNVQNGGGTTGTTTQPTP